MSSSFIDSFHASFPFLFCRLHSSSPLHWRTSSSAVRSIALLFNSPASVVIPTSNCSLCQTSSPAKILQVGGLLKICLINCEAEKIIFAFAKYLQAFFVLLILIVKVKVQNITKKYPV